ncbi:hypothetical protein [Rhodopirellula baltica]|nr:hypothetical protein [Rhodopirellula baltica]
MDLSPEQLRFIEAVRKPKHHRREIQLQKRFNGIPRAEQLDTLLYIFTHSNNYGDQQDCSRFLPDLVSDCDYALEELLMQIAPTWNLSVEELPDFLADVYGAERVVNTSKSLATQHPDDSYERRSLGAIAWWLKRRCPDGG